MSTTNRDGLIEKIKALLNKTVGNGCSEEEMSAALDKATALMDAYEITEDELRLTKEEVAVIRREPPDSLDPHNVKFKLMGSVADFCNCKVWQKRRRDTKVVEFCGLPSDARLATWLLDTLAAFVQAELVNHLTDTLPPPVERRKVINGFVEGCCDRISARLKALCAQSAAAATSNGRELVLVKSAAVTDKMKACGIKVRGCRLGGQTNDSGYAAGHSAGDRASFGRPVTGAGATLRIK